MPKTRYVLPIEERRKRNAPTKPRKLKPPEELPLTGKQLRFVNEYVLADGMKTQSECARLAGYGEKSAAKVASQLLRTPHVMIAVQKAIKERDEKYGIRFERHLRDLQKIRDQALDPENLNLSAAVQAEYRRGQVGGLYINRSEIRHGSIDSMSKDEVLKALHELRGTLINGEAEEVHDEEEVGAELLEGDQESREEATPQA
tara:strand:- start:424 stop:1029 length:606 start_codon:yes stop_codon:yes gene_type:complete